MSEDASARGDVATHRPASDLLVAWFKPLTNAIQDAQKERNVHTSGKKVSRAGKNVRNVYGRLSVEEEVTPLLALLPPDATAVITLHTVLSALLRDPSGVALPKVAFSVANSLRAEVNMKKIYALQRKQDKLEAQTAVDESFSEQKKRKKRKTPKTVLLHAMKSSPSVASAVNYAAQQVAIQDSTWSARDMLLLGTRLINLMMKVANVEEKKNTFVPALVHFQKFRKAEMQKVGMLQLTDPAFKQLTEDSRNLFHVVSPKHQPMIIRPKPWTSPKSGAYLRCHSHLVRTLPMSQRVLNSVLKDADLSTLYKGLNALGDQPWCVNPVVLKTAENLWEGGGAVAGLVSRKDAVVPEKKNFMASELLAFEEEKAKRETLGDVESIGESVGKEEAVFDEKKAARKLRFYRRKAQKMNRELASIRADTNHRLNQAKKFRDEEKIFLPHNVDFRGRAYPIPVHLQHMGCDLTRALLTFGGPGVELGPRGVYWLKIHLANMLGADKLSFDERIERADDALSKAADVGRHPTADRNIEWWCNAEDPFQLLAACGEVAAAMGRYGGERAMESYASNLPISMDGSCNGLQHYAALGRDVDGGTQVNLVPNSRPQDVYSGVAMLVNEKIDKLAAEGDEIGLLLKGKISRKVVKQTVMTSVYGVTLIGARQQISNRLSEIEGFPEGKLFGASLKLASLTLMSLGDIFSGATRTMDWLYSSASRISKKGHEVQWITPVGLPVIQPYKRNERMVVRTLMQRVTLERHGKDTPVSCARQRSAFAPNFVHSIDSAHMLLTGLACHKKGVNFAAVHDSFWTNAACVDTMNSVLREEFIRLHSRDLLAELREGFYLRYGNIKFDKLPPRGDLDLNVVRDSPYFFS